MEDTENRHMIDSRHCQKKDRAKVTEELAHEKSTAFHVESLDVNAHTNADVVVRADDGVSECKSIGKDRVV